MPGISNAGDAQTTLGETLSLAHEDGQRNIIPFLLGYNYPICKVFWFKTEMYGHMWCKGPWENVYVKISLSSAQYKWKFHK